MLHRYWLHFDPAAAVPVGWPPVLGVTGRNVADCLEILRHRFGRSGPPPISTIEDPDLSDDQPLGVPVWRGIWFPPENLTGPQP